MFFEDSSDSTWDCSEKLGEFSIEEEDNCSSNCGDDLDGSKVNVFGYELMDCSNCHADDIVSSNVDKSI